MNVPCKTILLGVQWQYRFTFRVWQFNSAKTIFAFSCPPQLRRRAKLFVSCCRPYLVHQYTIWKCFFFKIKLPCVCNSNTKCIWFCLVYGLTSTCLEIIQILVLDCLNKFRSCSSELYGVSRGSGRFRDLLQETSTSGWHGYPNNQIILTLHSQYDMPYLGNSITRPYSVSPTCLLLQRICFNHLWGKC